MATMPFWAGSAVPRYCTVGTNPLAPSFALAFASVSPVTFGTLTVEISPLLT